MKKSILLFLIVVLGLSTEVYGQETNSRPGSINIAFVPPGFSFLEPLLPRRDTVIMRGEKIEVGAYLGKGVIESVEVIGYGKSTKSDLNKGIYTIKLKPKRTTTYEYKYLSGVTGSKWQKGRIVYVAKTVEEKKMLEEKINARLGPREYTTYQYQYKPKSR